MFWQSLFVDFASELSETAKNSWTKTVQNFDCQNEVSF